MKQKALIPCGRGHVYWSNRSECPGCNPMPKKWHLIDLALLGGIIFWLRGGL